MITDFEGDKATAEEFARSLIEWGLNEAGGWEEIHHEVSGFTKKEIEEVNTLFGSMFGKATAVNEPAPEDEPEEWKGLITREQFLDYFRSDKYNEEMSADDCIEIFSTASKGSSDITKKLIDDIANDYSVGNLMVIQPKEENDDFTKEHFDKALKEYGITNLKVVEVKDEQ